VANGDPVTKLQFSLFSLAVGLLGYRLLACHETWVFALDDANLLFHEAGHPFFGILGGRMGLYGGTLGSSSSRSW